MSTVVEQEPRLISVSTPLGENALLLQAFEGQEAISQVFSYQLEMLSDNHGITAADIVGQNVTVSLKLTDGETRYINGFVQRFIGSALHSPTLRRYRAEVVPWLWFLTRTQDCRIFQNKTVPQIIEQVFQDFGFNDFEMRLAGDHPERVYCVQYRETAFNFISRLMEVEGIFYWFRHEDGKHTLVLGDHTGAYEECAENEIDYVSGDRTADHINTWEHRYEFRSGKFAQTDYNFETPSTNLLTSTNTLVDLPSVGQYELYDYFAGYSNKADGETLTKLRMEEEELPHDQVECSSTCRTLQAGGKFRVAQHECPSEEGASYVITAIQHAATDTTHVSGAGTPTAYQNALVCIPSSVVFRPARITPHPEVRGPQTAKVTGPAGEEIYTDQYGRVKVQFHWDRYGQFDENSSCWMRVSQVHAGKGFGGIDTPRIGEEVIVEHLEANPDNPIVTGRVYHAENMPPNGLPGAAMVSGLKSNSTPGGGGDNTMMFDDTKGNEKITIHGQYNMDTTVENDQSTTVHNNRTDTIDVDDTESVGSNQKLSVGANRDVDVTANHTEKVGGNQSETISGMKSETISIAKALSIGAGYQVSVGAGMNETIGAVKMEEIGGAKVVGVGAYSSENVGVSKSVTAGTNITESAGANFSAKAGADFSATAGADFSGSAGGKMSLSSGGDFSASSEAKGSVEAASELILKCGGASIVLESGGKISIKGTDIAIKGSGKISADAGGDVILKGSNVKAN